MTVGLLHILYPLCGVYNISFFALELFTKLKLGGAETVAVITALVRVMGTFSSSLLLLRLGLNVKVLYKLILYYRNECNHHLTLFSPCQIFVFSHCFLVI